MATSSTQPTLQTDMDGPRKGRIFQRFSHHTTSTINALLLSFGVGKLSPTSGIARALYIVGVPSTVQRKNQLLLYHTLGNGVFTASNGKHRSYSDIADWDWQASYRTEDKSQLNKILNDSSFACAGKVQLVEIVMKMFDPPRSLQKQMAASG
ncbi:hypothetical protein CPB84DRAFT_1753406 [Gymnopilus junonius]|uniref:Uncharacterized protein n=1 Tax=Gymnopilus junonius TaxID=109634 RepID=A0A9P5N7U6_GYMJU|nr:hypothetical protein CPB84DRAFT_1753406 [Gymnopilus junonius]